MKKIFQRLPGAVLAVGLLLLSGCAASDQADVYSLQQRVGMLQVGVVVALIALVAQTYIGYRWISSLEERVNARVGYQREEDVYEDEEAYSREATYRGADEDDDDEEDYEESVIPYLPQNRPKRNNSQNSGYAPRGNPQQRTHVVIHEEVEEFPYE